ncbi:hypothetical protein ACP6PL_18495 [Dapis sp. BLCC M126]|uniref:hypothetical protein n=1 Tax=Dapis sp. BLCC M126 TaxID=3400189 RepID=UPI003CE7A615
MVTEKILKQDIQKTTERETFQWTKQFDVWETHTKHCLVCQDALKNINRLKILTYVVAGLCLCLGIVIDARAIAIQAATAAITETGTFVSGLAVPPLGFWFALGGATLFAFGGYKLQQLSRLFYVYEFEHADNRVVGNLY